MRIVVTGGAGFIGANLCRVLAEQSEVEEVIALDDLSSGSASNIAGVAKTELVEASILDTDALASTITSDTAAVVHLAARPSVPRSIEEPVLSHDANATGTLRVLEAMRASEVRHVVVASSSSVYGDNPILPKHEGLATMPASPYAASKLAAESYALAYARCFDFNVLAFRFFNVFGPLQPAGHAYAAVIPAFVAAALKGEPLIVHGDGRQTRDFTYVHTVASTICDALIRRVGHSGPVNLAFGTRTDLLEVIDILEDLVGRPLNREFAAPRVGDVRDSQADTTQLQALFPELRSADLREGLQQTLEWMASSFV